MFSPHEVQGFREVSGTQGLGRSTLLKGCNQALVLSGAPLSPNYPYVSGIFNVGFRVWGLGFGVWGLGFRV